MHVQLVLHAYAFVVACISICGCMQLDLFLQWGVYIYIYIYVREALQLVRIYVYGLGLLAFLETTRDIEEGKTLGFLMHHRTPLV